MEQHASAAPIATRLAVLGAALVAVILPTVLALNVSPSVTFFNQAAALVGWGVFCSFVGLAVPRAALPENTHGMYQLLMALGLMATAALASSLRQGSMPWTMGLSAMGLILAAMLVAVAGTASQRSADAEWAFGAFCAALVLAGAISLVLALVQYFLPDWISGEGLIARITTPGRAGGNLRQPNHLSSLLLWAMVALVWGHEMLTRKAPAAASSSPWLLRIPVMLLLAGLVLGDVLTVSRTGMVCIALLALWGLFDKRLSPFGRVLLLLTPVFYAIAWFGVSAWAQGGAYAFAGESQLHKSDLSSSRLGIWSNTLALITTHPLFGIGWGEFNFAWTLTPFPGRPVAFFDHTHNLPLQLLVELGIPLGLIVMALLGWALWKGLCTVLATTRGNHATAACAFVMVLMMVIHSQLEYPLWYAYFLLPTAFAFGACLGIDGRPEPVAEPAKPAKAVKKTKTKPTDEPAVPPPALPARVRPLVVAGMLLAFGGAGSMVDYLRVTPIFVTDRIDPLDQRIAAGQKSWFFGHHADYAAATVAAHPSEEMAAFRRATHFLLDTRLMVAWATALHEAGDTERARYLVERMKEFRNPDAEAFLAPCNAVQAGEKALPFQCKPPTRALRFEDFRR